MRISIESTSIEDISKGLADVYKDVGIAKLPMFGWVQIVNDTTILAESVRRNRKSDAIDRAGRILLRILEYIGYFTYCYQKTNEDSKFADIVHTAFNATSYSNCFAEKGKFKGPKEGPTRWILWKYPYKCSKCGKKPCECLLKPWIFEERREKPGPYDEYKKYVEEARLDLINRNHNPFTLTKLFDFFNELYRNSYYHQDPWKLCMHLTEEIGEVTTELSRLELAWVCKNDGSIDLKKISPKIYSEVEGIIEQELKGIEDEKIKTKINKKALSNLKKIRSKFGSSSSPWDVFIINLVSERLKEEIADVFSWLSAVINKLCDDQKEEKNKIKKILEEYTRTTGVSQAYQCRHCKEKKCKNECLVEHEVADEIKENVLKF